jgi:hypothetical protein
MFVWLDFSFIQRVRRVQNTPQLELLKLLFIYVVLLVLRQALFNVLTTVN